MKRTTKLRKLLPVGIAMLAMMLLSSGLSSLELRPGQPFTLTRGDLAGTGNWGMGSETLVTIFRVALIGVGLLTPIALAYAIVSPKARRQLVRDGLILLLFVAIYYLLFSAQSDTVTKDGGPSLALRRMRSSPPVPPAVFAADPPRWLISAASIGLSLLLAALLVGIGWLLLRRRRPAPSHLTRLSQHAQRAADALQAGADLRNTVIRCYREMAVTLRRERGIRRSQAMTPREFGEYLGEVGLPAGYVTQLTRLFEDVRYGAEIPGQPEQRQAILCLRGIVEASRRVPGA